MYDEQIHLLLLYYTHHYQTINFCGINLCIKNRQVSYILPYSRYNGAHTHTQYIFMIESSQSFCLQYLGSWRLGNSLHIIIPHYIHQLLSPFHISHLHSYYIIHTPARRGYETQANVRYGGRQLDVARVTGLNSKKAKRFRSSNFSSY